LSKIIARFGKFNSVPEAQAYEKTLTYFKTHPSRLYQLVHDDVTPGYEHNARLGMSKNSAFNDESNTLTDAQIETAVKHVLKKRVSPSANPRSNWGKTEFSAGPLKSQAAVKRLAAKLKAKHAPYAQDAGRYADRYWDSILAQPAGHRSTVFESPEYWKILHQRKNVSGPRKSSRRWAVAGIPDVRRGTPMTRQRASEAAALTQDVPASQRSLPRSWGGAARRAWDFLRHPDARA
jgi:hypothetical protein